VFEIELEVVRVLMQASGYNDGGFSLQSFVAMSWSSTLVDKTPRPPTHVVVW
jgi:hypothetical protein